MATPTPPLTDDLAEALTDDLVEAFLRRLPPEDPASLVRSSLVCKRWRRILADRGFCRRLFCGHHQRRPAMLGFFGQIPRQIITRENPLMFTPTSSFRPRTAGLNLRRRHVVHACHGRVLLAGVGSIVVDPVTCDLLEDPSTFRFAVWDPIMGNLLELPRLPLPAGLQTADFSWNAMVLCASVPSGPSSGNNCDHLDCHRGPFVVVFVGTWPKEVCTYVYSSQAGTWSHTASAAREPTDSSTRFDRSEHSFKLSNASVNILP